MMKSTRNAFLTLSICYSTISPLSAQTLEFFPEKPVTIYEPIILSEKDKNIVIINDGIEKFVNKYREGFYNINYYQIGESDVATGKIPTIYTNRKEFNFYEPEFTLTPKGDFLLMLTEQSRKTRSGQFSLTPLTQEQAFKFNPDQSVFVFKGTPTPSYQKGKFIDNRSTSAHSVMKIYDEAINALGWATSFGEEVLFLDQHQEVKHSIRFTPSVTGNIVTMQLVSPQNRIYGFEAGLSSAQTGTAVSRKYGNVSLISSETTKANPEVLFKSSVKEMDELPLLGYNGTKIMLAGSLQDESGRLRGLEIGIIDAEKNTLEEQQKFVFDDALLQKMYPSKVVEQLKRSAKNAPVLSLQYLEADPDGNFVLVAEVAYEDLRSHDVSAVGSNIQKSIEYVKVTRTEILVFKFSANGELLWQSIVHRSIEDLKSGDNSMMLLIHPGSGEINLFYSDTDKNLNAMSPDEVKAIKIQDANCIVAVRMDSKTGATEKKVFHTYTGNLRFKRIKNQVMTDKAFINLVSKNAYCVGIVQLD